MWHRGAGRKTRRRRPPPGQPASCAGPRAASCCAAAPPAVPVVSAGPAVAVGSPAVPAVPEAAWGQRCVRTGSPSLPPLPAPAAAAPAAAVSRGGAAVAGPDGALTRLRLPAPQPPHRFRYHQTTLEGWRPTHRPDAAAGEQPPPALRAAAPGAAAGVGGPPGRSPGRRTCKRCAPAHRARSAVIVGPDSQPPGRRKQRPVQASSAASPAPATPGAHLSFAAASCARSSVAARSSCWRCCSSCGPSGSTLPSTDSHSCGTTAQAGRGQLQGTCGMTANGAPAGSREAAVAARANRRPGTPIGVPRVGGRFRGPASRPVDSSTGALALGACCHDHVSPVQLQYRSGLAGTKPPHSTSEGTSQEGTGTSRATQHRPTWT